MNPYLLNVIPRQYYGVSLYGDAVRHLLADVSLEAISAARDLLNEDSWTRTITLTGGTARARGLLVSALADGVVSQVIAGCEHYGLPMLEGSALFLPAIEIGCAKPGDKLLYGARVVDMLIVDGVGAEKNPGTFRDVLRARIEAKKVTLLTTPFADAAAFHRATGDEFYAASVFASARVLDVARPETYAPHPDDLVDDNPIPMSIRPVSN